MKHKMTESWVNFFEQFNLQIIGKSRQMGKNEANPAIPPTIISAGVLAPILPVKGTTKLNRDMEE